MIHIYTGKTGSGKTFQMIKDVYPLWKKGTDIYSNTYLIFGKKGEAGSNILKQPQFYNIFEKLTEKVLTNWHRIRKKPHIPLHRGHIVYFEDITELLEVKNGIILMDEGQNLLEARNWENMPFEFSNKLRQHRKHQLDLYATTQNLGTIDINLRRLVQRWIHCKVIFRLFGLENPNLFTIHTKELKDIDELYNQVDDLQVKVIKKRYFIIHLRIKRIYDTMYDIGFTTLKSIWIQENEKTKLLIIPKTWNLEKGRTQLLLFKYYFDQNKSTFSKPNWKR